MLLTKEQIIEEKKRKKETEKKEKLSNEEVKDYTKPSTEETYYKLYYENLAREKITFS